jgi:N-dimethylarginine dimethylaminohydrolase
LNAASPSNGQKAGPSFLLCPPTYYDVSYAINPYMDPDRPLDRDLAMDQWQRWKSTLESAGATIEIQDAVDGLPDLVFTNNAGYVHGNRVLLTRFRDQQRVGETPYNAATFERLGFEVHELPESAGSFEGAAEAIQFGDRIVCAHGLRTSETVIELIGEFTGLTPLRAELNDPRFYHLDISFCPLDERTAIVAPPALRANEAAALMELVPDPIELTEEETSGFSGNAVVIGRTVFMHRVFPRVGRELEKRGFDAVEVPVTEFLKAGGSLKCLSLRLDA